VEKATYEAFTLGHVVDKVFGGQPLALARRLVEANVLSDDELAALRELLARTGKDRP
jgi:predicted transcriptional regulator